MASDKERVDPTGPTIVSGSQDPDAAPENAADSSAAGRGHPERIGNYRIVGRLGHGGMGIVYRAEDEKLRRTVALKVMPPDVSGHAERRRRFLQEARAAAAITHSNVAGLYEVEEAPDGQLYLAMELVEGTTLRARMESGPLSPTEALRIARGIARGLAFAHRKAIVHRDLKPENIMIGPDDEPKILDFGLAKDVGGAAGDADTAVTQEGVVIGTPAYMSPEQALGRSIDLRSDVFSFGIVLYEMLEGTRPFGGSSAPELIVAIARDPVPPLRNPAVGDALAGVVRRCLAKDPGERFADAGAILAALSAPDAPASGGAAAPPAKKVVTTRRGRATLALVIAVLALAATAGWRWRGGAAAVVRGEATPPQAVAPIPSALDPDVSRSTTPEAQAAFQDGWNAFREGTGRERTFFDEAIRRDPRFGGALLRRYLAGVLEDPWGDDDETTEELGRRTMALVGSLTPRDRELLAAVFPNVDEQKLRAYLSVHPHDDFAWSRLGALEPRARQQALAWAETEHIEGHGVWYERAIALGHEGAAPQRLEEVARQCVTRFPGSVYCLGFLATALSSQGRCDEAERVAQQLVVLLPDSRVARLQQAALLAGTRSAARTVAEVLRGVDLGPDGALTWRNLNSAPDMLALYEGDFTSYLRLLEEVDAQTRVSQNRMIRQQRGLWMAWIATESGDPQTAADIADRFSERARASPIGDGTELFGTFWDENLAAFGPRVGRAARYPKSSRETTLLAAIQGGFPASTAWVMSFATEVETPDEARVALAVLDGDRVAVDRSSIWPPRIGKTLFLGGRQDQARPYFEDVVGQCDASFEMPLEWVQSHLYLGLMEEQAGRLGVACAHYGEVVRLWGEARPRSITADEARKHARSLRCPEASP